MQFAENVCEVPDWTIAPFGEMLQDAAPNDTVFDALPPAPPVNVIVADDVSVHVLPEAWPQPPHVIVSAAPVAVTQLPVSVTVSPVTADDLPLIEQLAAPELPPEQSSVDPLNEHDEPLGSLMVMLVCACAPYPRVRPNAAVAAHNQVRKRIMNLSLPLTSPG